MIKFDIGLPDSRTNIKFDTFSLIHTAMLQLAYMYLNSSSRSNVCPVL